jgi:hypothetical protein
VYVHEIALAFTNGILVLSWPTSWNLQYADSVVGPWFDLPGAFSPYVVVPTGPAKFFRLVCHDAPTASVTPLEAPAFQADIAAPEKEMNFNKGG